MNNLIYETRLFADAFLCGLCHVHHTQARSPVWHSDVQGSRTSCHSLSYTHGLQKFSLNEF